MKTKCYCCKKPANIKFRIFDVCTECNLLLQQFEKTINEKLKENTPDNIISLFTEDHT